MMYERRGRVVICPSVNRQIAATMLEMLRRANTDQPDRDRFAKRRRAFRLAYRLISGVTEMPWSRTDAATVESVIAISSLANGSGKP